jgi:class 3 adenylate cyclase
VETGLARHNAAVAQFPDRAAAAQVRLRVAINAGEVTLDRHGIVGVAIDYSFRLAEASPLKTAFANSPDVCGLIVSDWFYADVVNHHPGGRADSYQHVECRVKQTPVSGWMRVPVPTLPRK